MFTLILLMNMLGSILGAVTPSLIDWGMKKLNSSSIGRGVGNKLHAVRRAINSQTGQKLLGAVSDGVVFPDEHIDHHPDLIQTKIGNPSKRKKILKNGKKK